MAIYNLCAKMLHEEWAKNKRKQINPKTNKPFTQVWKDTNDEEYDKKIIKQAENGNLPKYIKIEDGKVKIDILNMPYEELSNKWKKENLEAGITVEEILGIKSYGWLDYIANFEKQFGVNLKGLKSSKEDLENFDEEKIEKYAEQIHNKWMKRRLEEQKANPNIEIDESLMVPYENLPFEEKLKDKVQVMLAMEVLRSINKGIHLDYLLDRAYGDTPVFNKEGKENTAYSATFGSVLHKNLATFTTDEVEIIEGFFGKNSSTVRFAKNRIAEEPTTSLNTTVDEIQNINEKEIDNLQKN